MTVESASRARHEVPGPVTSRLYGVVTTKGTKMAGLAVPIRYMGTKRHIAHRVRRLVTEVEPKGRVIDLFSGMGCVAESLADVRPVMTNDAHEFTAALARARFTGGERAMSSNEVIEKLRGPFRAHLTSLRGSRRAEIRAEERALDGPRELLAEYMRGAEHVGNSDRFAHKAVCAAGATGADHYQLATLYFSAGYYGVRQSIEIDALRYAIDRLGAAKGCRDWMIGAWLAAAACMTNAPGHTAQFLKPNSDGSAARIRRYWRRSVWDEFQSRLVSLKPIGTKAWRARNRVEVSDALRLLERDDLPGIGAVYADPPYTRDQYSRFYHVYETLYRYDYPRSSGEGRVRPDRFSTGFSQMTGVHDAFTDLFDAVADLEVPLILSYPSAGLLADAGHAVSTLASARFNITKIESFGAEHSTLGASQGTRTKTATENLYVCQPA